jgi:hypothetical protein
MDFKYRRKVTEYMRDLYVITQEHRASFDYALVVEKGDIVEIGKEDMDSPGWYWCKGPDSVEAWVPETYLFIDGERGLLKQPYNSTEHSVVRDEVVQYLGDTMGWMECLDRNWKYGWIPLHKAQKIDR